MDKKNGFALAIMKAMPKPPPGSKPGMGASQDSSMSDEEMAADEIIQAVHGKDAAGLAEALESFIKICQGDGTEEESEGEGASEGEQGE